MTSTKHGFGLGQLVRSILLGGAALAIGATVTEAAAATVNNDKFPRLGMYTIAGPQRYDSSFWSYAAKFHVVIINGSYETWQRNRGYSKESVIQGIKGQSRVGTRVFQYVDINELGNASNVGLNQFPTWYNKVNANKWWLYAKGTSGTPVTDPQSSQRWIVNMGPNVPVDGATGLGPYAWAAKYLDDYFHLGRYSGTSAAPSLDGFMLDNVLIDPSNGMGNLANGDWLRNGTTQSHNAPTTFTAVMAGEKSFYSYLQNAWPNGIQLGNVGNTFGIAVNNYYSTNATLNTQVMQATSALSNLIHGGDIEHILGKSFSPEAYMGASSVQLWYRTALANSTGEKLMIFSHGSMQPNGSDPLKFSGSTPSAWSPAYQGMRYGLAAALMNNGYYYADDGVYDQETASHRRWFDEFDNSGAGTGYLGSPVAGALGNAQTAAWSNGVWMREFQNGVVLWNPKGNGAKTVSLAALKSPSGHAGLKKLIGHQNPGLNNGAVVSSVTLQDRDGLILLWVTP
jgi:hypothetical protein